MSDDLHRFIAGLNKEVHDRASSAESNSLESSELYDSAFTELILDSLSEAGSIEDASSTYFSGRVGRGVAKVNGYAVGGDEDHLDLFVTVFLDAAEPKKLPLDEVKRAIEQALRYGLAAIDGLSKNMDRHSDAYSMTARIGDLKDIIRRVRISVLSDGIAGSVATKFPDREHKGIKWKFELWDGERLFRLLRSGVPRDEIDIDLDDPRRGGTLPCVTMPASVTEYQALLTILPGELLFHLFDEFGDRLMELNVQLRSHRVLVVPSRGAAHCHLYFCTPEQRRIP